MEIVNNNGPLAFNIFSEEFPEEAKILAPYQDKDWVISLEGKKLMFKRGDVNPIFINIDKVLSKHRVYFFKNSIYKEPLAKAIGLKKGKEKPHVVDATGGMLGDTLLIKAFGVEAITVFERHPVSASLIVNALQLFPVEGINFKYGQLGREYKGNTQVVYFDPMYGQKNEKTAPKKEMKIFREVIGEDIDAIERAKELYELAGERLVIKRSAKVSPLLPKPGPNFTISGKSTSYDVYLKL